MEKVVTKETVCDISFLLKQKARMRVSHIPFTISKENYKITIPSNNNNNTVLSFEVESEMNTFLPFP